LAGVLFIDDHLDKGMELKDRKKSIHYSILVFALLASSLLAAIGLVRLDIDTDVLASLPADKPIISDALAIFKNHPMLEQIAVDVRLDRNDPDMLVDCGRFIEEQLRSSGLFDRVGMDDIGNSMPAVALRVAETLPLLFSAAELEQRVAPRLTEQAVTRQLESLFASLSSLQGIGQAAFIDLDPLGLKDIVLARMAMLAPSLSSRFHRGMLLSADSQHLLVTARPAGAGTDTGSARSLAALLDSISDLLTEKYRPAGVAVTLTPVGAFRAALDNETIIRHDVNTALILAMAGISLLLLFSFPRPLIGLLSLVPALAGSAVALFVYSLFNDSISIMVLGFGGAVISITVDHGIAWLLFLDRPCQTRGSDASHEVRAVGLPAVLTTICAFLVLCFSGFPMFVELGQFTALGVLFSFLFVHGIFPRVFPVMPSARSDTLPLQRLVDCCANTGRGGAVAALLLALVMLFFMEPGFNVSLNSMNTVSRETEAADALFSRVWGNLGNRVFLMLEGADLTAIQRSNDRLLPELTRDLDTGLLDSAFSPSMLFPGLEAGQRNFRDWQQFWTAERVAALENRLGQTGRLLGFSDQAFTGFSAFLSPDFQPSLSPPDPAFYPLLGIAENHSGKGLVSFITLKPGAGYDPNWFHEQYSAAGRIYDGSFFSEQLGRLLFSTFSKMLLILGVSITLFLLFFFVSFRLTLLTLLPVIFAYICTLGTLHLLGRSLDIPSLMLSIVILGMGIDYSIFFVRAHQRYRNPAHPSYGLVRMAVFMAAASTLIGFGVLAGAEHSLLQSIGVTCLLGIGYSLLGAFLLLPPLLDWLFAEQKISLNREGDEGKTVEQRVRRRFSLLEPYPRMFARFKLKYDPMFTDLVQLLPPAGDNRIQQVLDIGCGYGVPACWCLEYLPATELTGLDPDPERVRVAGLVTGSRARVVRSWAPDLPELTQPMDLILLLDMLHYIDDTVAGQLLENCFQAGKSGTVLVARYSVCASERRSWLWYLEESRIRMAGTGSWFRTPEEVAELFGSTGFSLEINRVTNNNPELFWLRAKRV
jgi:predicted exporter/SAM-dependent methyltransferase